MPATPTMSSTPPSQAERRAAAGIERGAGHKNMLQLIQLRWIAVAGQITTIAGVSFVFDVKLPLPAMFGVLACLIAFNIACHLRWHEQREVSNNELFFGLLIDVASLSGQLYFGGGIANPFAMLFLQQIIISAVLLEAWSTWSILAVTSVALALLAPFSQPLVLPQEQQAGYTNMYIQGILISFVLNATLLVFFITRIIANLRAGDAQLADLRQRAVEQEHIVRMGLLATGAAHELGTPLATLSVILGDWRRMPQLGNNTDLMEDISEMQTQLQRCKGIVSGILMSAGEARGESAEKTTINTFLDELVVEWRSTRPVVEFVYENKIAQDVPVVFDSALKQMICNVLDNALEASPNWLSLEATQTAQGLALTVLDAGPGFLEPMLANFGKPYQSSKGRAGRGLGLFLVVNVARTLGGTVLASNRATGGAQVQLTLPLAAVTLEDENRLHVIRAPVIDH